MGRVPRSPPAPRSTVPLYPCLITLDCQVCIMVNQQREAPDQSLR